MNVLGGRAHLETATSHISSAEIPSLDGWRAIAILVVFISHAGLGKIIPGGFGVTIFFFLSGYLITSLMVTEKQKSGTISIYKFYVRRFLRLAPPLLITLALVYSLTYCGLLRGAATWQGFTAQVFYFANYYDIFFDAGNTIPAGTGVFWSLAVEEHFYIFFPWVFLFMSRSGDANKLIRSLIIVCLFVLLWRCCLVFYFKVPENRTYYASDTRIDSIIFGVLLALIKNPSRDQTRLANYQRYSALIFPICLIMLTFLFRSPQFRETFRYSLQGIALAPLFYLSIRRYRDGMFRALNSRFLKYVGKCSYSMYLIHYVLIENFGSATQYFALNMFVCFLLSICYAAVIDKFVDQPIRKIRVNFR